MYVRRTKMDGMEVLVTFLVRLHRPCSIADVSLEMGSRVCPRAYGETFLWMVDYIYGRFRCCINDLTRWHLWVRAAVLPLAAQRLVRSRLVLRLHMPMASPESPTSPTAPAAPVAPAVPAAQSSVTCLSCPR